MPGHAGPATPPSIPAGAMETAMNPHAGRRFYLSLQLTYPRRRDALRRNMASINVNRATSTLSSPAFAKSAVLIVVGSIFAQLLTDQMRQHVYDVNFAGGDALYAVLAAMLVLVVLPGKYGRPLALGSTATAVRVVSRQMGLI